MQRRNEGEMLAFLPPPFQHVSLDKICPVPFPRLNKFYLTLNNLSLTYQ